MNRYYAGVFALIFTSFSTFAQFQFPVFGTDTINNHIHVSGSYGIGQNALSFRGLLDTWNDDFLEVDEKESLMSSFRDQNRLGTYLTGDVSYVFTDDSKRSHRIGLGHHRRTDATFTREALYLALFGNSEFADQWYNIGKTTFDQMHFSKVYYHRIWQLENSRIEAGIQLNIGHRAYRFHAQDLKIYTAPDGEYIDIYGRFNILLSDTANPDGFNGIGGGVNFRWDYHHPNSKYSYNVSINGLGAIYWDNQSVSAQVDDTIRFNGIQVDNIIRPEGELDQILDSLNAQYIGGTQGSQWLITPTYISAQVHRELDGFLNGIYLRGEYIAFSSILPRATLGVLKSISKNQLLIVEIASPAYDRYGLNVGYRLESNQWGLELRIQQLSTVIAQDVGYGLGAFLTLRKNL